MKIGVIGAGNWGQNLVRNFAELGVLAGVADSVEEYRDRAKTAVSGVTVLMMRRS